MKGQVKVVRKPMIDQLPNDILSYIVKFEDEYARDFYHFLHKKKYQCVLDQLTHVIFECKFPAWDERPQFYIPDDNMWDLLDCDPISYAKLSTRRLCFERKKHYCFMLRNTAVKRELKSKVRKLVKLRPQVGEMTTYSSQQMIELFKLISNMVRVLESKLNISISIKKLENVALSFMALFQCTSRKQFMTLALMCIGQLTEKTLIGTLFEVFSKVSQDLWDLISSVELRPQGKFRDAITGWERMSDSKILDKLREFMSFCLTFGTLEWFGLSENIASIVYGEFKASKRHKSVFSFALAFCDVLEFVFSRLCVCVETKSLTPLFHSADDYAKWYDNCTKIVEWDLMLSQDCLIRPFTDQEFQKTCEDVMEKGEEYIKFAKSIKDRRELNSLVSKVRIIYGNFMTSEIIGRPREAPFTILLTGDSSIGKTSIMYILRSVFAHLAGLPDDPRYFYTRDPTDEFMSGFKSYQWFINMDDVATTNPKLLSDIDKSVSELFKYVQNIAITANMADLKDKGKVAIRPAFIVASSNAPTLNAEAMFTCPSAARRRLPWRVTPTVKKEFRIDEETNMLDPSKCTFVPGQYPDYWLFDVDEIRPKPLRNKDGALNLDAQEVPIMRGKSLKEFLSWFVECAKTHRERQKFLKERMDNSHAIEKCIHSLPKYMCCAELSEQADITTIVATGVTSSVFSTVFTLSFLYALWMNIVNRVISYPKTIISRSKRYITDKFTLQMSYSEMNDVLRNVNRESIRQIGQRAQDQLMTRSVGVFVTIIIGALAIWKLSSKQEEKDCCEYYTVHKREGIIRCDKPVEQQVTTKQGPTEQFKYVKPVPVNEKQRVVWNQPLPIVERCNILPQSVSSKARSKEEFLELLSHNIAHVTCRSETKQWRFNVFFAGGFDVVINTHIYRRCPDVTTMEFLFHPKLTHIGMNTSCVFDKRRLPTVVRDDITIIQLENFGPFKDFRKYFAKSVLSGSFNSTLVHRLADGGIEYIPVMSAKKNFRLVSDNPYNVYEGYVRTNTVDGTCGSPLVLETSYGFVIGGIHSLGGSQNIACSSVVTTDLFSDFKFDVGTYDYGENQPESPMEQVLEVNQNKYLRDPVTLIPRLRSQDPLAWRKEGLGMVYGSLGTGPSHPKSAVEDGLTRAFWEEHGMSTNCVKPIFSNKCWHNALDDMMSQDMLISNSEILHMVDCLSRDFINALTREDMEIIEFYDIETAINGADLVNGVDKLDFNTSTGFPLKKPKKTIFTQMPNGKYSCPQEVIDAIARVEANLEAGIRNNFVFSSSLKDEVRELMKVLKGSIRAFMGAPLVYCIVMRMYFLSLCRLIQRNPLKFETAVGINAHSDQWDHLANYLLDMSKHFIVGDHSKYDKRMLSMVIYNMFKVAINVILHCMLTCGKITVEEEPELRRKMLLLAVDTAYAYVDFNGTLVSFLKNHPSGHVLTVIINSFTNSSYIRMAYSRCVDDDPDLELFQSRCRVVTYGDDFIVAVRPEFTERFNFITAKAAMATFGVIITPAVKDSDDYTTLDISQIDFLKRRFVYSEDLKRWVGPLDVKSIEKSLLISLRSKSITPEEQAIYTMMSANQEMFFHGRYEQERFRSLVKECVERYELQYLYKEQNFPSYDQFLQKYRQSSYVNIGVRYDEDDQIELQPDYGAELHEQCECRDTIQLNALRVNYDPDFEHFIERNYSHAFDGKWKGRIRKLVLYFRCRTPYGFSCTSFCEYCQLSPKSEYVIDKLLEDYYSPNSYQTSANNMNALCRVGQQTSTTNEMVEVRDQPCDHTCLWQPIKKDTLLHPQMSETNIEFVDEIEGNTCDLSQAPDDTRTGENLDRANFASYLNRPVQIYTTTWNENASLNLTFNPWLLWAQQASIKSKLNNFMLFRGNLHLKMLVNASPFFYGAGRLTYEPLINYMRKDTVGYGTYDSGYMIAKSQQKGFEFYPQTSQGGEMVLPFFYPKTWVDVTSATDLSNMGRCSLFSYTPLLNANSVTTASVTISIIAWCENAELSGPTATLAVQSEYKKLGPISGPASAVAEAARSLAKIPVLKPYAMGTEVIASGVGSVARYFGFTNVPNTEAQTPMKPGSHYGMATTEISTPYEKLSLDDKNELTVDPRTVGLPPKDEMVLKELLSRESYLTSATWSATAAANSKLFNTWVTPNLYDYTTYPSTVAVAYYQPPMAHISRLFQAWRGNIIFRFRFVCTAFHKGRVRITWDPKTDLSALAAVNVPDTVTTSFTKIVDIGETQDVEMEIPFMQALSFLSLYGTAGNSPIRLFNNTSLPVVVSPNSFFNGSLSVTVMNAQTSPVTSSDISMLVFVRAADNFVFANPSEAPFFSCLAPQAEEMVLSQDSEQHYMDFTKQVEVGELFKVHMGEAIHSVRQLIHRQNYYTSFVGKSGTDTQSAGVYNKWNFPMYPQLPGYMNSGRGQFAYAKGIIATTATYPVSYCAPSVFNHIAPLYIGARGSIVYNVNVDAPQATNLISLSRSVTVDYADKSATTKQGWYNPSAWDIYNPSSLGGPGKYRSQTYANGAMGRVLTNQNTQAGLAAHFPYYSPLRFTSSIGYIDSAAGVLGVPVEERTMGVELTVSTKNNQTATVGNETATVVDVYMMAGHDFSFLYFNCVPTFYWYLSNYSDV